MTRAELLHLCVELSSICWRLHPRHWLGRGACSRHPAKRPSSKSSPTPHGTGLKRKLVVDPCIGCDLQTRKRELWGGVDSSPLAFGCIGGGVKSGEVIVFTQKVMAGRHRTHDTTGSGARPPGVAQRDGLPAHGGPWRAAEFHGGGPVFPKGTQACTHDHTRARTPTQAH